MNLIADRMYRIGTESSFKTENTIARCEAKGMRIIRLNSDEPNFNTPDYVKQTAIDEIKKGNPSYCSPAGMLSLRKAISNHILKSRGIEADPNQIVVTNGPKAAIGYALLAYVNPGDEVIYPSPGSSLYESWTNFVEAEPVPYHLSETNRFNFSASELEKLITPLTKVIIINSPSNPTGAVLSRDELVDIADVIKSKCNDNVRVFSDEQYEHILFDNLKHTSIASMKDMLKRTIVVGGYSKSFSATGWRLGYALLPTFEEAEVFANLNINFTTGVSPFIQEAEREGLENQNMNLDLAKIVREFEKRRNFMVPALNRIDGISCYNSLGSFYLFPNISGVCQKLGILEAYAKLPKYLARRTTPARLFQRFLLFRHGVATSERSAFGVIGSEGKHYIRISLASDIEMLKEGVERIRVAARNAKGFVEFFSEEYKDQIQPVHRSSVSSEEKMNYAIQ